MAAAMPQLTPDPCPYRPDLIRVSACPDSTRRACRPAPSAACAVSRTSGGSPPAHGVPLLGAVLIVASPIAHAREDSMAAGRFRTDITASMHLSTVDLMAVYREVASVSARAGVIVMVAFIEDNLEKAILARLRPLGKTDLSKLTEGVQAPLNTLYAKIQLGYALYLFGTAARDDLIILKDIRNRFAHKYILGILQIRK